jgi:hypothetical protein
LPSSNGARDSGWEKAHGANWNNRLIKRRWESTLSVMERTSMTRPKTRILVDGDDTQETRQIKELLGFVDGQTTNPG